MSRHGYSEDCDDNWAMIRWGGMVASSIRGKRGQEFFRDLITALDEMPQKRLIKNELRKDGEVCALGALGAKRGMDLESLDPHEPDQVAEAFNIAAPLAREVVWQNDEMCGGSPEKRWEMVRAWAQSKLKTA